MASGWCGDILAHDDSQFRLIFRLVCRLLFPIPVNRKENQFSICKFGIPGFCHITKQGIAGRIDMIGNRIFGDGNILGAAGGAGGFGKINRLAFPEYIVTALFDLIHPGPHLFIIPDGHGLPELFIIIHFFKPCFFANLCDSGLFSAGFSGYFPGLPLL